MKNSLFLLISALVLSLTACNISLPKKSKRPKGEFPLEKIKLPAGFKIDLFATDVANARSLALSPKGTLFVGTRGEGKVYALRDNDKDNYADERFLLAENLKMPNGVALRNGDLYVAEVHRILRFKDIENNLDNPTYEVIYDQYPTESHHGWKYIAFGPDGYLYVPVGAPCNICESDEAIYNTITKIDVDNPTPKIIADGVRNSVGFDWHPATGELWFTDNGRDMMGDDVPNCELNHAPTEDLHFGYPYCHEGEIADPKFGDKRSCDEFTKPAAKLGAHTAPLGIEFYTGKQFPMNYQNQAIIALHGSWNRSKKVGYNLTSVMIDDNDQVASPKVFAEGWLDKVEDEAWGRPVDIEQMPDGSILVSDDFANAIYRISFASE